MRLTRYLHVILFVGFVNWAVPATAQGSVEAFYKGRTVTIIAGSAAGGGIDVDLRPSISSSFG